MFTAATFNANSVRSRLPIILEWLGDNLPDVLCIQETKVQDPDFPVEAFTSAGYHVVYKGQKSYNGVAIVSRAEAGDVSYRMDDEGPPEEARFITAKVGHVTVVNTYVPQGTAIDSPKFQYKLDWFARVGRFFERHFTPDSLLVWCGDLNVALGPADVYDPKRLAGGVCFHPDEQAALGRVMDWGFVDVFRKHCRDEGQYTFWDYRLRDGLKRNLGWRLDYILATKPLAEKSTAAWIDRGPRALPKPSDHTFLVARFDI